MGLLELTWSLLFPETCLGCRARVSRDGDFCPDCAPLLEPLPATGCRRCAEPGRYPGDTCHRCAARPPPFDRAFAPFVHGGPLARAIHRFKYEDRPELARPLGLLLARQAAGFLSSAPALVVPLPLHRRRFLSRRYDQAGLLAAALAGASGRRLGWMLERARPTARQVGLPEAERERNVHGAFHASPAVSGEGVLLVDDVLTTGATARAAARALREAGARRVEVLTLARAWSG
jgi:ComF family protein